MRKFLFTAASIGLLMCGSLLADRPASHGRSQPDRTPAQIAQELETAPETLEKGLSALTARLAQVQKQRMEVAPSLRKKQAAILELERKRALLDEQLLRFEGSKNPDIEERKRLQAQIQSVSEEIKRESKAMESFKGSDRKLDRIIRDLTLNIEVATTRSYRDLARDAAELLMQVPSSDSRFLEGLLAAMTDRFGKPDDFHGETVELLASAARRDWNIQSDETVPEMLRRNRESFEKDEAKIASDYRKLRDVLAAHASEDERLRLQERELLWSEVLATVIRSMNADDPATLFRERATRDPRQATAYYMGYQAIVEARPTLPVNVELLLPIALDLVRGDLDEGAAHISLLQTFARRLPADQRDFVRLRMRLVEWLKMDRVATLLKESNDRHPVLAMLASLIYTYSSNPQLFPAGRELLETLSLTNRSAFYEVTVLMKMPAATQRSWLLKTAVDVSFDGDPARDALRHLAAQVNLPIWIDQSAMSDLTQVRLKASGPWIDVLTKILAQTSLTAEFLSDGILWIGPRDGRLKAEATLGRSMLRLPDMADGKTAIALRRPVTLDFHETPTSDAIEFLGDFTGLNVVLLTPPLASENITLQASRLPTYLALTLITESVAADWRAGDDTLALGAPEAVERFWRLVQSNRLRMHHLDALRSQGSTAAAAMLRPVTFDFNQTPITDIAGFLEDYTGAKFKLKTSDVDAPVTLSLQEVSMAWGLDLLSFQLGLTWDVRGDTIFVGDEKAVAAFRAETDASGDKPKK